MGIYGREREECQKLRPVVVGSSRSFISHAFYGRGKTGSSSKQAINGHMWVVHWRSIRNNAEYERGKTGVSEAMLHVGGARHLVPSSRPYTDISGWIRAWFQILTLFYSHI